MVAAHVYKRELISYMITHKCRGCIVVLSINKSVEPNEEQKVLTSGFYPGITTNTSKQVFSSFGNNRIIKCDEIKGGNNNCSKWPNPLCSKGQAGCVTYEDQMFLRTHGSFCQVLSLPYS